MRARFRLALVLLVGVIVANIGFLSWSGRQRERVFEELHDAISRHSALSEAKAWVDDQQNQVSTLRQLLADGINDIGEEEEARILADIADGRSALVAAFAGSNDPTLLQIEARIDSVAAVWESFYEHLKDDPEAARADADALSAPLAEELLSRDLPAAIRAQDSRVQLANSAFARSDRRWSRAVRFILLLSAVLFGAMSWSTSRDLIGAVDELETGADRFGASDLGHRVKIENFEELEGVAERLNTMAHRLKRAHEELAIRNEELALLAFRDPLTKLSNRALFRERVEQALNGPDAAAGRMAILFIDLDNFKAVNDTFGHNTGDRLLVEVAGRLLHTTRGCDTVARLGGDEFGILLVGDESKGLIVAERTIASLRKPFNLDGLTIHVGASIGLARGGPSDGADELLRNADVAMYAAKEEGRNRYRVFEPAMHEALLDRAEMEGALRAALDRDEIRLEYQPIVDLSSESIVGYEALVRWRHPLRGNVEPSAFIPLAEDCGVILPIGRRVLQDACRDAAQWEKMLPAVPITVSVNVSSRQLEHPGFIDDLTGILRASGLSPERLVLEITESVIMRDSVLNLERLRQMKALGIRLAIDDFGTGFSSLAYLQRFPVDVIKIDKAFVKSVAISASDAALARTIVMLSDTLHLKTVAEGIEYRDQQETLRALGCDLGQGYLFSKPVAAREIRASLRAHAQLAGAAGSRGGAGIHIGLIDSDLSMRATPAIPSGKVHRA